MNVTFPISHLGEHINSSLIRFSKALMTQKGQNHSFGGKMENIVYNVANFVVLLFYTPFFGY